MTSGNIVNKVASGVKSIERLYDLESKRVAYLTITDSIGGAENNLLRVMAAAPTFGVLPQLLLAPREGPLVDAARQLGIPTGIIPYHEFRWRNPLRYGRTLWSLYAEIRHANVDIIHLNHQYLAAYAVRAAQLTGRPLVCHIRNLLSQDELMPLLPWLMRADAVVGVSQAVLDPLLAAGLSEARTHLIHNGLDMVALQTVTQPHVLRNELRLPESIRLVGVLGRVVPEKGIEDFIDAAQGICQQRRDLYFVVIGKDDEQGAYIRRLQQELQQRGLHDLFTFTGFRSDIPNILHDLDLVVLPSRSDMPEGLPNTVLEALAVGNLVVATRNSGVPEVIQDGVNGFLVECDDVDGLAVMMERVLWLSKAEQSAIQSAARQSVKDRTVEKQVQRLSLLYSQLQTEKRISA